MTLVFSWLIFFFNTMLGVQSRPQYSGYFSCTVKAAILPQLLNDSLEVFDNVHSLLS